jgi:hypothetical protein
MTKGVPQKLTTAQLEVFSAFLGSAPVLSTEESKHYDEIWEKLIECFTPQDFMELLLIRQVQNETWKVMRYTRHQTVAIDRRFRQSLEFHAQRMKERKARREFLVQRLAEQTGGPATELAKLHELSDTIESSVSDVDDILFRTPTELDHNRALEAGIVFEEQLDRLINSAHARRNSALEQLELYREGLGQCWRQISDDVIDVSLTEVVEPPRIEALSLAPPQSQQQPANGGSSTETDGVTPLGEAHLNESVPPKLAALMDKGEKPEQASA